MADKHALGNLIGLIVGALTLVSMLAGAIASYVRLQATVESQAATLASQAQSIETLTNDLHGFQDFFMDFLASRNVTIGPLDPDRYSVPHDHAENGSVVPRPDP